MEGGVDLVHKGPAGIEGNGAHEDEEDDEHDGGVGEVEEDGGIRLQVQVHSHVEHRGQEDI